MLCCNKLASFYVINRPLLVQASGCVYCKKGAAFSVINQPLLVQGSSRFQCNNLAAFSVISQLLFVPESSRFCCKKAAQTMTAFCTPMWPWFVHKPRLHFVPGCGQVLCSNMATFCAQNAAVFCAPMQPCIVPKLGTKPSETRLKSGNGTEFTPHVLPMGL